MRFSCSQSPTVVGLVESRFRDWFPRESWLKAALIVRREIQHSDNLYYYVYGLTIRLMYELTVNTAQRPHWTRERSSDYVSVTRLNREKLTFYHNGINRCLTDVHGEFLTGILS